MKKVLILLSVFCLLLVGCRPKSTTVILPPEDSSAPVLSSGLSESASTAQSTAIPTDTTSTVTTGAVETVVFTEATEPETSVETGHTEQSTQSSRPSPAPTSTPTTAPTSPPASTPTSAPPATASTTAPATVPATAPSTQPSTEPSTEPATEATSEATTEPTAAPTETTPDVYDISSHSIGSLEYEILAQINACRAEEDLPALTMDSTLCALSAIRAYECTASFSHIRPDGRDCFSVLADYGCSNYITAGENLLYGTSGFTAAQMVSAWMNSEGHRANILNPDFTRAGIGICYAGGYVYAANLFIG